MDQTLTYAASGFVGAILLSACSAAQTNVANSEATKTAAATEGAKVTDENLPINQRFHSLDEYLAWLQQYGAPADHAWYKEIRPGVYELQTGNFHPLDGEGQQQQRTFTREELEKKFGFKK